MNLDDIRHRPLAEQCAHLDRLMVGDLPPGALQTLASWPDPAPLAYVLGRVLAAQPPTRLDGEWATALARAPDAHLGRVLRGVPDPACPPDTRRALVDRVVEALEHLPPARVAAACFLLRWIGQTEPQRAAGLEQAALDAARGALSRRPEDLSDRCLLRLPGRAYAELQAKADAAGFGARWTAHLGAFAARMLDALQRQPKSLAQVGAEALLSRRVYTDPTHFLMELIQNAEDADARIWRITVELDRLIVEHDGVPFDARDVVGVLSIGQTTKSGARIGFFGVGFKSVYAVTDRPRIRSGPFDFEIADVSIPRPLIGGRPAPPGQGTRLELPLRDPGAGRAIIGARALALPATLLLTLRHIERLEIVVDDQRRVIERAAGQGVVTLRDGPRRSAWWVMTTRERAEVGDPVAHSTLVASPLDDAGEPTPLDPAAPAVFCFLPTRDRPGLRMLIHARFPLPVDRERVDIQAPATAAALRRAGALMLARAIEPGTNPWPLLALLPLLGEVQPPIWGAVREGFAEAAVDVPLVPAIGGERVPLARIRRAGAPLAEALGAVPLPDGSRVISPPNPRGDAVLEALGVAPVTAHALIGLIGQAVATDGSAPGWLDAGAAAILGALREAADFRIRIKDLGASPIAPDAAGRWRAPAELARCPDRLRPLFGHRPLLAASLDTDPHLGPLWRALALTELDDAAVAAALRDPAVGPQMCAAGPTAVLAWMAGQPTAALHGLGHLAVVRDERDGLRAIVGGADLPARGSLGAWARRWPAARPALVEPETAGRFGPLLTSLGTRRFDVASLIDAVDATAEALAGEALGDLHGALDRMAGELTPRIADRLARAALFTDVHGHTRPLRGPGRAIVPERDDLQALLPDGPWLDPGLRRARHVALIGPEAVTAVDGIRGLLDADSPLYAERGTERWRRLAEWATQHAPPIAPELRARLTGAPIWQALDGSWCALAALRTPPDRSAWAALYAAWDVWPAPAPATRALATALGASEAEPVTGRQLVHDLAWAFGKDGALDEPSPAIAELLAPALAELGRALPPDALQPLGELAIHPDDDGTRWPLARWRDATDNGAHRADPPWRAALKWAPRPLLTREWQASITPLLDTLGIESGDAEALAALAERSEIPAEARPAIREALVQAGPWDAGIRARLSALRLWPTTDGRSATATEVCPPARLDGLPTAVRDGLAAELRIVGPAAAEADRLADTLDFASAAGLLAERVAHEARPGEGLAHQPMWLGDPDAVAAVRRALREGGYAGDDLSVRIDIGRRLARGPLFAADADLRELAMDLPIARHIAHPDDRRPDEPPDQPLPARRLLADLADAQRAPGPVADHPILADAGRRMALYRWLTAAADEIDRDAQARGLLGRAATWLTRGGTLRPARALMPVDTTPEDAEGLDSGLDWTPADEIPAAVRGHLRRWFRLDARRLRTAVDHIVEAHRRVGDDPARSAALVGLLARLLDASTTDEVSLEALVARFKLHRVLKVADASGRFDRPRALLAADDPGLADLIARFHPDPPQRPHPSYPAEVARLLRAAGAAADLDDVALDVATRTPLPGLDAGLARATYLAARADAEPAIVERLGLTRRPWLFDRDGAPCAPDALDWPDAELDALIGPDVGRRPHPALVHAMPPAVLARLPVRTAADADPMAVARQLPDGEPAPIAALRWFDDSLDARRITPEQARAALAGRRVFGDDHGQCRRPEALVRDLPAPGLGRRRGGFSDGRPVPRLLGALGIPAAADGPVMGSLLDEIAAAAGHNPRLLADEPELAEVVPRVVRALMALGGERPAVVLVDGALVSITAPDLAWPWPAGLAESARRAGAPLRIPHLSEIEPPSIRRSAARWRVATVADRWRADPERSETRGTPLPELSATLVDLWRRLPRLGLSGAGVAPSAVEVADADAPGRIGRVSVPWPRAARVAGHQLYARARLEPAAIALALWQDRLDPGGGLDGDPTEAVARIARLIACRHGAAMDLLLDAEGLSSDPRTVERRPAPARPSASAPQPPEPLPDAPHDPVSPAPAEPDPPANDKPDGDDPGLLDRLKRWWQGDRPPEAPPAQSPPETPRPRPARPREEPPSRPRPPADDPGFRPPDTSRFFQPQRSVEAQLHANPSWLATRQTATEIGFAFAPSRLAGVHQYGPALIADRYDPRSRRWTSAAVDPQWSRPPEGGAFRVAFNGRLPTGEAGLAVPLFGRVAAIEAPEARHAVGRDGRPVLIAPRPLPVRYTVELARPPRYVDADPPRIAGLLAPTVPDAELPAECHDLIGQLLDSPPRARISGIGQFVRRHYRYDPSYLEDPAHARWLRQTTRGRANPHVAALHAGRDGRHLGAGVCYELNALVCELARRSGLPAAIATGWTFDRGWIDQPDHLWAMVLLASEDGPRWLPVDASTTHEGRPLHAAPRPPGPHRAQAPRQDRPPPTAVDWTDVPAPPERPGAPLRQLLEVIRHAERLGRAPARDEAARLAAARLLLTDPVRARALLALVEAAEAGEDP